MLIAQLLTERCVRAAAVQLRIVAPFYARVCVWITAAYCRRVFNRISRFC